MLVGEFAEQVWWPGCIRLRECTRVGYESAWRCHIQPKWGMVELESITATQIEDWLSGFDHPGAARKAWAVLRAILRLAYRKGITDNDVSLRRIGLPHLHRYEPQVLDVRQVRRLLRGFHGHALEAWLLVSVCAGLRPVGQQYQTMPVARVRMRGAATLRERGCGMGGSRPAKGYGECVPQRAMGVWS